MSVSDLMAAAGLGAVTGARSMLGPALTAPAAAQQRRKGHDALALRVLAAQGGARALAVLAAGELVADKLPGIPSRIAPGPLAARIVGGALVGSVAAPARRGAGALAGALGAFGAAHVLYRLRRAATEQQGVPNAAAGLCEDVLVLAAGVLLSRRL